MSTAGEEIRKLVTRAQSFTSSGEHDRAAAQWQEVMAIVLKANALEPNRDYVRAQFAYTRARTERAGEAVGAETWRDLMTMAERVLGPNDRETLWIRLREAEWRRKRATSKATARTAKSAITTLLADCRAELGLHDAVTVRAAKLEAEVDRDIARLPRSPALRPALIATGALAGAGAFVVLGLISPALLAGVMTMIGIVGLIVLLAEYHR
ncbi:hypothetical protein LTV02_28835 [Nocardia yamanashiensis]|uniref:hypothetical protein n=1 Tax=Nocardia yamanashiensis TaxID=209247 RepID=UPI001E2A1B78|nr:hypothetical protein [Nocardia yamanashiensis]UGT40019.1 hypothetical protein LTV02_28835 [Nocardia yamanashiensis]